MVATAGHFAVKHFTVQSQLAPRFRVSIAADKPNAEVHRGGWSVRLKGRSSKGSTLTLGRGDDRNPHWRMALDRLTASKEVSAGAPVHLSLTGGHLNRHGALLTRTLAEPLPRGATANLAYYDGAHDAWRGVPTKLSNDRRTLRARVHHFSVWDDIVYGANWLLDLRVSEPKCDGDTPKWVDSVNFLNDKNGPLRWCTGHDPHDDSVLVLKVAVNRSYGVALIPALTPKWSYNSIFQANGPEDLITSLFARAATDVDPQLNEAFGGQMPLMGGQQADFGFTEAQVRGHDVGRPLMYAAPDAKNALVGFTYNALVEALGLGDDSDKRLAAITALVAIAQCEGDIITPFSKHHFAEASKGAVGCLTGHPNAIERLIVQTARASASTKNLKDLKARAKTVKSKLWEVWGASALFKAATWFADRHLISSAFEVHVFPKIIKPKPLTTPGKTTPTITQPTQTETTPQPTPGSGTTGFAPGSAFSSSCVVAWPTAPTHTSQGIEMTMSCGGVPESKYLFTQVVYNNTNFTITPSTGQVHVTGHVVDTARSELGYSTLIVEADDIQK